MSLIETEEELKQEICEVSRRIFERGLASAIGGNVSARLPGANEFWITPSGVFKGKINPDDLVKLDLEGNIVEGYMKPSIEWPFHAAIYKARPDVNAVVHAHNPVTVGLALAGKEIKPVTVDAIVFLRKIPIVPFRYPGTDELAKAVAERIAGARCLVLQNHGVIGVGHTLLEAEAVVETLEEVAIALATAYRFTDKPAEIPEREFELIRKLYRL